MHPDSTFQECVSGHSTGCILFLCILLLGSHTEELIVCLDYWFSSDQECAFEANLLVPAKHALIHIMEQSWGALLDLFQMKQEDYVFQKHIQCSPTAFSP